MNWTAFTPISALVGGGIIGLAVSFFLLLSGRVAGMCGACSFVNAIPFIYLHCTKPGGCGGKAALLFNATFNLALVLLFGNFFKRNYSRASAKSKKP